MLTSKICVTGVVHQPNRTLSETPLSELVIVVLCAFSKEGIIGPYFLRRKSRCDSDLTALYAYDRDFFLPLQIVNDGVNPEGWSYGPHIACRNACIEDDICA